SSGSNRFIHCDRQTFLSGYIIEGNTVVNTTSPQAISCDNQGPNLFMDNAFYSSAGATTPVILMPTEVVSDMLSIGNTFSTIAGGAVNTCGNSSANYVQTLGRCHALGDQTTSGSPPPAPTLPGTPPQYCASGCSNTVSVTEVTAAMTTSQIQTAITN